MANQSDVSETICAVLRDRYDLAAVYLFGSVAQGQAHTLSDVDVAVLFSEGLSPASMFAGAIEIGALLEEALHRSVDVVTLNEAPPVLSFQVRKHGRLLLERDCAARCLFVMRALNRYYDLKPYLDYHTARLVSRINQEGLGRGYSGHRDALIEARRLSAHFATDASRPPG